MTKMLMLLKSLDGDIPIERAQQQQNKESNKFLGNFISQVGACNDENINKNAKFIEVKKKESCEISPQFASLGNQFKMTYKKARRSITKTVVQFDFFFFLNVKKEFFSNFSNLVSLTYGKNSNPAYYPPIIWYSSSQLVSFWLWPVTFTDTLRNGILVLPC